MKLRCSIQGADIGAKGSSSRGSLKVLDILWQLVCDGHLFFGVSVSEYEDWGSRMAWEAYASRGRLNEVRDNGNELGWSEWVSRLVPGVLKRNVLD